MEQLKEHPVAKAIRMMNDTEYEALRSDIAEHGLLEPIVLYEGQILDGRNRYRVCQELGVEPDFTDYKGTNPLQYVRSLNVKRRHLSRYELVLEALKDEPKIKTKAKERQKRKPKSVVQNSAPQKKKTRDELAMIAGVSHDMVEKVKVIEKHAAPQIKEKLRTGEMTIHAAFKPIKKKIDKKKRSEEIKKALQEGDGNFDDRLKLICAQIGDFEPGNVDLIITDPPYSQHYIELTEEISIFAQKYLKENGSLLVMCGQYALPTVLARLTQYMHYQWTFAYLTPGGQSAQLWKQKINTFWKPVIWLTHQEYKGRWHGDVFTSEGNDKRFHKWGQSVGGIAQLIEQFSDVGQTVCDPMIGGGTTAVAALKLGRKFIGADIEQECLDTTMARVRKTCPCKP